MGPTWEGGRGWLGIMTDRKGGHILYVGGWDVGGWGVGGWNGIMTDQKGSQNRLLVVSRSDVALTSA